MAQVHAIRTAAMSRSDFRAFVATRPDEERWELIGGVAMMMNPPTKVHQRIASNLERLLNDALDVADPTRVAYQRIGVTIEAVADYDPEPDVVVVDADEPDERYARRFHLVAEIVSTSDARTIDAKRAVYRLDPTCRVILTVDQHRAEVRVEERRAEGWTVRTVRGLDARVDLADPAVSFDIADLYRKTGIG